MKIRWFIDYNGNKTLQYCDEEYWNDVDIVFANELEWRENERLKERIKQLEKDYKGLMEVFMNARK